MDKRLIFAGSKLIPEFKRRQAAKVAIRNHFYAWTELKSCRSVLAYY